MRPTSIEHRVAYLTLRFNSDSVTWQFMVWSRQVLLVVLSFIADNIIRELERPLADESTAAQVRTPPEEELLTY